MSGADGSSRFSTSACTETSSAELARRAAGCAAQDQRAGDGDALALAAGELVRVAEAVLAAEADFLQRRRHPPVGVAEAWMATGMFSVWSTVWLG